MKERETLGNTILTNNSFDTHGGELCVITVVKNATESKIVIAFEATRMIQAMMGHGDDESSEIDMIGPVDDWLLEETVQELANEQADQGVLVCVYDYQGVYGDRVLGSVQLDPDHWTVPGKAEKLSELQRLCDELCGE